MDCIKELNAIKFIIPENTYRTIVGQIKSGGWVEQP